MRSWISVAVLSLAGGLFGCAHERAAEVEGTAAVIESGADYRIEEGGIRLTGGPVYGEEIALYGPPVQPNQRQEPATIDEPSPRDEPGSEPPMVEGNVTIIGGDDLDPAARAQVDDADDPTRASRVGAVQDAVSGTVVGIGLGTIDVRDPGGQVEHLWLDDQTAAYKFGRQVPVQSIEEGAGVRTSYVEMGDLKVAREIQVTTVAPDDSAEANENQQ